MSLLVIDAGAGDAAAGAVLDGVPFAIETVVTCVTDGGTTPAELGPAVLDEALPGETTFSSVLVAVDGGLAAVTVAGVLVSSGFGMLVLDISDLVSIMDMSAVECLGKDAPTINTAVCSPLKICRMIWVCKPVYSVSQARIQQGMF